MFWYCARPREFFIYIRLFGREREYPNTERWLDEKLEAKIGLGDLTHICASLQFFPTVFRCLKSRFWILPVRNPSLWLGLTFRLTLPKPGICWKLARGTYRSWLVNRSVSEGRRHLKMDLYLWNCLQLKTVLRVLLHLYQMQSRHHLKMDHVKNCLQMKTFLCVLLHFY